MKPGATALTVMPRRRSALVGRVGVDEPDDAGLGCRVVALAAVAGDAGDRRDEHDVAALAQAVLGEEGLVHPQDRPEVDVEHRGPAVGVGVGEQLVAGDAGVVHDDVEPTVAGAGVAEDAADRRPAAVTSACRAVPPISLATSASAAPAARHVDAHDGRTVAREGAGDVGADAAGRAGDDGDLAGERAVPDPAGGDSPSPTRKTWAST